MPIDVLLTNWEELKDRLSSKYDIEELCDTLGLSVEDILDKFQDLVYTTLPDLGVTTEMDYQDDNQET